MCGLGFVGLIMFGVVVLMMLFIVGMLTWYLVVNVRQRLSPLPSRQRVALGSFLVLASVSLVFLGLVLVRDFLVTGPCLAP